MKVSPQSDQSTQSLVDLRLFFSASFLTVFPSKAEIGVTDKCGLAAPLIGAAAESPWR